MVRNDAGFRLQIYRRKLVDENAGHRLNYLCFCKFYEKLNAKLQQRFYHAKRICYKVITN